MTEVTRASLGFGAILYDVLDSDGCVSSREDSLQTLWRMKAPLVTVWDGMHWTPSSFFESGEFLSQ